MFKVHDDIFTLSVSIRLNFTRWLIFCLSFSSVLELAIETINPLESCLQRKWNQMRRQVISSYAYIQSDFSLKPVESSTPRWLLEEVLKGTCVLSSILCLFHVWHHKLNGKTRQRQKWWCEFKNELLTSEIFAYWLRLIHLGNSCVQPGKPLCCG